MDEREIEAVREQCKANRTEDLVEVAKVIELVIKEQVEHNHPEDRAWASCARILTNIRALAGNDTSKKPSK